MTNTIELSNDALAEYSDEKRLEIYKLLTSACSHFYSKGKLQEDKFLQIAEVFADLTINDPIFMAHLTAYVSKQDSKDLKVLATFFNSLNDADGTPFFKGSELCKPNYREVSYAVLQDLSPHLAERVLELAHKKFGVKGYLNHSRHFSTGLKTAFRKYISFREENPEALIGIKNSGMSKKFQNMYRLVHMSPSKDAAKILRWKQKNEETELDDVIDFSSMSSSEIVEYLTENKLSPMVALSSIPKNKITAKVAKALLNNATGNQSIVLYNWFSKNGFLDVKSINDLFKKKASEATTAVDRIDTLTKDADEGDKSDMAEVRASVRKKVSVKSGLGSVYVHIDASSSMNNAIHYAKENASVIAECVDNPEKNFGWGLFNDHGRDLEIPKKFVKESFHEKLYGARASGCTDCLALYSKAREKGASVDVYITDQGHNVGIIDSRINEYHRNNPNVPKPKAAVIVDFSGGRGSFIQPLEAGLIRAGIPVSKIQPNALKESALISQSVANAVKGELAIIEEIMDTPLPRLPRWWNKVGRK
jgi:hypothetical protein